LKVEEDDAVEEIVAANTLGTIVHESLENLYKENIGKQLTVAMLESILKEVETEVKFQFQKIFKKGNISKGKNLLIFEVAKRYIENFVHHEIREIKNGASISIQSLEQKLNVPFSIEGISFPVNLKGTVDRVDIYNGQLRIIDYKTGSVQQGELEITDWETIIEDYSHSKAFQVLTYCYIISQKENHPKYEAGIFSFKNLNSGFLKFATKPAPRSTKKDFTISQKVLQNFAETLTKLIKEICDPTIPFTEKEID
jgi:ATP-dependent helicase/nuclease subunit B